MLVVTRQRGESITIGDDVKVVVVDIRGDSVRIGIDAPRDKAVHRAEVLAAIQREREAERRASSS